jgi:hypothetical protein
MVSGTSAALKLQACLELCTGRLDVQLQEGHASDCAAILPAPLPAGALRLADLGDWRLEARAALEPQEIVWLSRLQMPTVVYDSPRDRRAFLEFSETQPTDTLELAVALGER